MRLTCPEDEVLMNFVKTSLPEDQLAPVLNHLGECEQCAKTVTGFETNSDPLSRMLSNVSSLRNKVDAPDIEITVSQVEKRLQQNALQKTLSAAGSDTSQSADFVLPDTIGPYEIEGIIGEGGMGIVFLARHSHLQKKVALKVLIPGKRLSPTAINRFEREILAVGKTSHPNIVSATDAGIHDGTPYLAMELMDGVDLHRKVAQDGILEIDQACHVIRQAALAVQYAHDQEVIHRDIKPSNLMLARDGSVKLLDLGLARLQESESAVGMATSTGCLIGTAAFMSPEQATDPSSVGKSTDVYGLGATFFYLLTGEAPYPGKTAVAILMNQRDQQVPSVRKIRSEVPRWIDQLIQSMMVKEINHRISDMKCVVETLDAGVSTQSHRFAALLNGRGFRDVFRRTNANSPVFLSVLALAFLLIVISLLRTDHQERSRPEDHASSVTSGNAGMDGVTTDDSAKRLEMDDARESSVAPNVETAAWPEGLDDAGAVFGIQCCVWKPDGTSILCGTGNGVVTEIDSATYRKINNWQVGRYWDLVKSVAWHPSSHLPAAAFGNEIVLWDDYRSPGTPLKNHTGMVYEIVWDDDGQVLISAAHDATARIWTFPSSQPPVTLLHDQSRVQSVAANSTLRLIATVGSDRVVKVFSFDGSPVWQSEAGAEIHGVDWSPDGSLLAVSGQTDRVIVLRAETGEVMHSLDCPQPAWCVRWSPDNLQLAASTNHGHLQTWRRNGEAGPSIRLGGSLHHIDWSPDGKQIAIAANSLSRLAVWTVSSDSGSDQLLPDR